MVQPRHNHHVFSDDSEPGIVLERPDWWDHAACRGKGPDTWFPTGDDRRARFEAAQRAKRVCATCPVQGPCDAQGANEPEGIWAGELRTYFGRSNRRPEVEHGTYNRYVHYKCRCDECRAAARAYHQSKRQAS